MGPEEESAPAVRHPDRSSAAGQAVLGAGPVSAVPTLGSSRIGHGRKPNRVLAGSLPPLQQTSSTRHASRTRPPTPSPRDGLAVPRRRAPRTLPPPSGRYRLHQGEAGSVRRRLLLARLSSALFGPEGQPRMVGREAGRKSTTRRRNRHSSEGVGMDGPPVLGARRRDALCRGGEGRRADARRSDRGRVPAVERGVFGLGRQVEPDFGERLAGSEREQRVQVLGFLAGEDRKLHNQRLLSGPAGR